MARNSKKRRKGGVSVDFTGVEASSRSIEDGVYLAEITKITEEESDNGPYLSWTWKTKPKKGSGAILYDNTSLQPQALWRLRLLLESIGEEIPEGVLDLDLDAYVGRECKLEITNEKYDGKNRPRISGFISVDAKEASEEEEDEDADDEEEEDAQPTKSKKFSKSSKKASKDEDEDEEDEEDSDDEEDEEEEEEDEKPSKKKGSKSSAKSSSKIKVGTKVKFKDEDNKWVKGVVTSVDDDVAMIEDGDDEEWEVEISELTVV